MELLKKLTQSFATSGNEEAICELIKSEIKDCVDEIYTDNLGNLIAHKKSDGEKFMIAAHMDEIGVMVTFVEKNGYLRFAPVGGLDVNTLINRRVVFENGTLGVISYEENIDIKKELNFSKMYIDICCDDQDKASKLVKIGDTAVFDGEFKQNGNCVVSKALDNRVGVYALINIIKKAKDTVYDMYYVFTSQEEIGLRGAKASSFSINPKYALAIDVTATGDTPNCPTSVVKLGGGTCIKIMDKSVISSPKMRRALETCAKENNILYQNEILSFGGTDAGAMQTVCDGAITGAISVPTRYIHTPCETANVSDINMSIDLAVKFITKDYLTK